MHIALDSSKLSNPQEDPPDLIDLGPTKPPLNQLITTQTPYNTK